MGQNLIQMNNLIVIGASGHGNVIADIAKLLGYTTLFWDDDSSKKIGNLKVEKRCLVVPLNSKIIIGIGSNKTRKNISSQYPNDSFISIIHPKSIISGNSKIGIGTVIMAGAIINNGVVLGKHCIVNTGAVIDHDVTLGDFVHISPNATLCGNVFVGNDTWIGAGSTIIHGINIGKNVIIGAGAVILNDVPDNSIFVGNPGRHINMK
jgi:sugar O-acyltransferase (sialic acid O-acetyltransferase NeuD family)